jgi:hypothetical protein
MALKEYRPGSKPDIKAGKGAPGRGQLYIDGKLVGNVPFDVTAPITFGIEGLSCGYDFGEAVSHDYKAPFRFTGTLRRVVVDVSGDLIVDKEAELRAFMSRQ